MSLSVDLEKRLGSFHLRVQFQAEDEITALLGASGCGKSMTLKCIAGIMTPDRGRIVLNDRVLFDSEAGIDLPPQQRRVGYLFQNYALFPTMTVEKNILCGIRSGSKAEKATALSATLHRFRLEDLEKRYPAQLSGGQQQRIAIARALATNPKILLCDEATSALDPKTTGSVLSLIKDINRKMGITVIVITHQMSVVEEICNKVSILDHGNVVEDGAVSEVFSHPKSEAAKRLVFPDGVADTLPIKEGEHHIRVVFNGADAANTPLIAKLAMETHIAANILGANTKSIEGKAYGNMLLGISGDENTLQQAIAYLQKIDDIIVEEVSAHVR